MPLVTVTTRQGKSAEFKSSVLEAVHQALVASGVPATDRFHRILELAPENFRYDPSYPDLATPRTENFVLIEIMLSVGRSVKIKKQIAQGVVTALQSNPGLAPDDVMIAFVETRWENWSFGGGRFLHA